MSSSEAALPPTAGLRAWLMSDTPSSGRQAACIRAYRGWRAFARNPTGLLGLGIVLLLVLCAAFAPWIATADPTVQNLSLRLQNSRASRSTPQGRRG